MIRQVEETDSDLLSVSYSKLDLEDSCNHRYYLRYEKGNYSKESSLPLELGTICHKVCEMKSRAIMEGDDVDYELLQRVLNEGTCESTDKSSEYIPGVDILKKKYFEEWNAPDDKSGMTYDQKISVFLEDVLPAISEDLDWQPIAVEQPFKFVYDNRVIISGFIDRVDGLMEDGKLAAVRVVDYKTSKKVYDEAKLKTPLQMFIYAMACYQLYGLLPVEYVYHFILLSEMQCACSKGYEKRGINKLNRILDNIDLTKASGVYKPNPTPLCYWCEFCESNPAIKSDIKYLCPYYLLWTPQNKTYMVNRPFESENKVTRKLIF